MACASPLVQNARRDDPTQTLEIRRQFLREVRRRFRELRGLLRRVVGYDQDALGLATNASDEPPYEPPFEYTTTAQLTRKFQQWLRSQIRAGILEPAGAQSIYNGTHWTATFVRASYERGWEMSTGRLTAQGYQLPNGQADNPLQLPVAESSLRRLYTRTYSNLQGITEDMADSIREELTLALAEGVNPREAADRITNEVRDIQNTRAETLARTETINAHSSAALDRFDRANVDGVAHGEWLAADDDRTCPVCRHLDGEVFRISEMRSGTFEFEAPEGVPDHYSGTYRLKPPCHPNGRCSVQPVLD